jgi:hypothetical protein
MPKQDFYARDLIYWAINDKILSQTQTARKRAQGVWENLAVPIPPDMPVEHAASPLNNGDPAFNAPVPRVDN